MYKWQAIEDFNGHLYLAILDEEMNCIWFHNSYEKKCGELIDAINNINECVSEVNYDLEYQKLIARDASAWWIIADQDEIYWDLMQNAALKEFTKNKINWI